MIERYNTYFDVLYTVSCYLALENSPVKTKDRNEKEFVCAPEINADVFRESFSSGYTSLITISHPRWNAVNGSLSLLFFASQDHPVKISYCKLIVLHQQRYNDVMNFSRNINF